MTYSNYSPSNLQKGDILKLKNPLLIKTGQNGNFTPFHWHIILEKKGDQLLLLPLSSSPLSKYIKNLPNISSNWNLECDPFKDSFNMPNQLKFWGIDMPFIKEGKELHKLSSNEWEMMLDTLYDDLYQNIPEKKKPQWHSSKIELMKYFSW